jgi:hypothetical protein
VRGAFQEFEHAVERVAHGPSLRARIVEFGGSASTVGQRTLQARAAGGQALRQVSGNALVDLIAGCDLALVVRWRTDFDGVLDGLEDERPLRVRAAVQDAQRTMRNFAGTFGV